MASSNIRWPICRIRFWRGARSGSARAARRRARCWWRRWRFIRCCKNAGRSSPAARLDSLRLVGCYIGIVAVSNLLLAAAAAERRRALADVVENEKRLRAVMADQTDLICRFQPDGTITFVNPAYCAFHGRDGGGTARREFLQAAGERRRPARTPKRFRRCPRNSRS